MNKVNIGGTFPGLAVKAGHGPDRSETGIGALMPWAGRLWFVTYVAHKSRSGSGTGLFSALPGLAGDILLMNGARSVSEKGSHKRVG